MSKPLRVTVLISLCVLLLSASCCTGGTAKAPAGSGAVAPVKLGAKDNATNVLLRVGQQVSVVLDSNPTTGYQWAIENTPAVCIAQVGESTYTSAPNPSGMKGVGGTEKWVFEGKSPGQTKLKLKYWRSFEPTAAPASTFEVNVQVR
jgi:inhibitor of cysteine peptidase